MMNKKSGKDIGKIRIKKKVINAIVSSCIKETDGIKVVHRGIRDSFKKVLSHKSFHEGIKVEIKNNSAKIYINAIVEYGKSIQEIATRLQHSIKDEVEEMSGLKVAEVDIIVKDLTES